MSAWRILTLLLIAAWLAGCATSGSAPGGKTETSSSRYKQKHDGAPDRHIDTSHVPDAVPRYEVRTMAGNKNPYTVLGKTYYLLDDESSYKERGRASWYGTKFHGERTSNGEIYDMYAMTAAHKTLPIPSYVRVTNTANGKTVVVRVNDRGPFHSERIIDLSYAAAQRIGILGSGTGLVDVEIVLPTDGPAPPRTSQQVVNAPGSQLPPNTHLQLGAFGSEASAKQFAADVGRRLTYPVFISKVQTHTALYRVRVGPLKDARQLQHARDQIAALKIPQPHVVYED